MLLEGFSPVVHCRRRFLAAISRLWSCYLRVEQTLMQLERMMVASRPWTDRTRRLITYDGVRRDIMLDLAECRTPVLQTTP